MPVRSNPQDATSKWVQNLSGSTARITAGVQAVQRSPGAAAAAAHQKWLQRTTAAADKWRQRVGAVSLGDWQAAMVNVGIPRVAQGAQAKQDKMQSFMAEFLPHLQSGVQRIDAMPAVTLEDGINRAVAMIRHNATFRRRGTGSGALGS